MALSPFSPDARKFLEQNQNADPASLMLQTKRFPGLPVAELVQQIQARQKAKTKIPNWAQNFFNAGFLADLGYRFGGITNGNVGFLFGQ